LLHLKQLEPQIKVGLLYTGNFVNHLSVAQAAHMPVYSMHPNFKSISRTDIRELAENGVQVYLWTINSVEELTSALESGVPGIITNFPARLKQLIDAQ
jgi:glycerophosphoryl diester phosphodiesterase